MPAGRRPPRPIPPDRSGSGCCLPADLRPGILLSVPAIGNDGGTQPAAIAAWRKEPPGGATCAAATARSGRR